MIGKIVGLAENLIPIALIGAGGIGKTSIALTVLHHDHIKQRFGDERWFIRCDQFPASCAHFLNRLSKVVGAGVENPKDLTPLRSFLSSKEMLIILDNAESILDPRGTNALETYAAVEELSQFDNVWLCITSRISTIPPGCETLDVPTLSMEAARNTFYRIHKNDEQPDLIDNILKQLEFHALSVTLLATVAHHNKWDNDRLSREWEQRRTGVLQTEHNRSLAATIELSLASPMFQQLGPSAREFLGVIAFFPQGVNENNIDWLLPTKNIFNRSYPTIPERENIFDKFCILSLTYRTNGFITMLAPLRDYLSPKDPKSSPLLRAIKKRYFTRLSVDVDPDKPNFKDTQWITSEDINVEHLLDILTSIDANSVSVWDTCACFMRHLRWHKSRPVVLGPKIEGLPDGHRSKRRCLLQLSRLFGLIGNYAESKRLLTHTLKLWRERRNSFRVAEVLVDLANTNRLLCLPKEGIPQAKEALEISNKFSCAARKIRSLKQLGWSLYDDNQLDAAEEVISRAIDLLPVKGEQFQVSECQRLLGNIYHSKGETEKAMNHLKTALRIASSFNWYGQLFWIHYSLAEVFFDKNWFDEAHAHVGRAKSYAIIINTPYNLGRAMQQQARFWYRQRRLEEAKSEALRVADVYERIGATTDLESCENLLRDIEGEMENPVTSDKLDSNGELLELVPLHTSVNSSPLAQGT